ncbi:unnamed protein product [Prunus brigantina]
MYWDGELSVVLICQSISLGLQLALAIIHIAEPVIPLICLFISEGFIILLAYVEQMVRVLLDRPERSHCKHLSHQRVFNLVQDHSTLEVLEMAFGLGISFKWVDYACEGSLWLVDVSWFFQSRSGNIPLHIPYDEGQWIDLPKGLASHEYFLVVPKEHEHRIVGPTSHVH